MHLFIHSFTHSCFLSFFLLHTSHLTPSTLQHPPHCLIRAHLPAWWLNSPLVFSASDITNSWKVFLPLNFMCLHASSVSHLAPAAGQACSPALMGLDTLLLFLSAQIDFPRYHTPPDYYCCRHDGWALCNANIGCYCDGRSWLRLLPLQGCSWWRPTCTSMLYFHHRVPHWPLLWQPQPQHQRHAAFSAPTCTTRTVSFTNMGGAVNAQKSHVDPYMLM